MNRKSLLGTISLLIIGTVFGAVLVSSFGWVRPSNAEVRIGAENQPVEIINPDAKALNDAFVEVAEKVTPSIVQITVTSEVSLDRDQRERFFWFSPFDEEQPRRQQNGGSGVIISQDGYILTNNHVVENATRVEVALHDNRKVDAIVVGNDPLTDLAVIKIDETNLPAAFLGNSENIKVGQWVMAIGNPLSLSSTVTAGIISATGRDIGIINDSYGVNNFIQTDAAINPGNSGGALVDLSGAVIGINSAIYASRTGSFIGYGFAIPINLAKSVAEDLISNGKVNRGYIGVNIGPVDQATAKALGLEKPMGIIIQGIVKDGAASKEDILEGDVILKIDGREVNKANELQSYVASLSAGTKVNLTIFRDGKTIERNVTLKARDDENNIESADASKKEEPKKEKNSIQKMTFDNIGLSIEDLSDRDKESYDIKNGVKITKVEAYSKAFEQRLGAGLVITEVDRKKIKDVAEFEELMNNKKGGSILLKVIDQQGNSRFIGLEIPN